MVTTERPNKYALSRAIDIYQDTMRPFLIRCLKRVPGSTVEVAIKNSLPPNQADSFVRELERGKDLASAVDVNFFPPLVQRNWRDVFSSEFGEDRFIQNELWMITEARNHVAHPGAQDLDAEYTRARLYEIADALGRINAPEQKRAVQAIRSQLFEAAVIPTDAAGTESRADKSAPAPISRNGNGKQPRSATNLKPWREVIRPKEDVAQGSYQQAEFAADLQQVYDGRADTTQYGNPVSFFNHTYITPGIRMLLVNTLKRLAGEGGDPVIQTKTGFGGGKTHSLIALYHLVRNADALAVSQVGEPGTGAEIRAIMEEADYDYSVAASGKVAVLDGAYLAPTDSTVIPETGDPLNTLWGVMAYQLGGQRAYEIVGEAARRGTSPGGSQLDALFEHVGPCVILFDEPVAYVRNVGAPRDSIYTFIQALTQSVRRSSNVALVITLPQSRVEASGELGEAALDRLGSLLGRIEAVWEPLAISETFEVVSRRLFGPITDPVARDQTCEAFSRMYSSNRREFPREVAEQKYLDRMKSCYPIHPEIFDRLYQDWSSIQDFQRTRGVLRMMASCVNRLYLNNDAHPLIMPGDLPLTDNKLANEFMRLLPGEWRPVVSEVDSANSRTDDIDKESQRFADVGGAARRIARAVFLGSASSGATRGVDVRQIRLGVVQPGHGAATYNDALGRMTGNLYYLYNNDGRYFFHAEENLNKVANDRANNLGEQAIDERIVEKLNDAMKEPRSRRRDVILYSSHTDEVPDDDSVRLVVLPPNLSLPSRSGEIDDATPEAVKTLQIRGDAPRFRRNTLLFLAAKRDEVRALRNEVKKYLAWNSIYTGDTQIPNLAGERRVQVVGAIRESDSNVGVALVRAYRWALAPVQNDPQKAEYHLNQSQTNAADTGEIFRSAFEKFVEDEALADVISPTALTSMLEQYVWDKATGDHLDIDALWDLMTSNVYMHRLRHKNVLLTCVKEGVEKGAFGYAGGYHAEKYDDLRFNEPIRRAQGLIAEVTRGVIIHPVIAALYKEAEEHVESPTDEGPPRDTRTDDDDAGPDAPPPIRGARRITARKTADSNITLDDFSQLREEIIRNLNAADVEITVEITVSAKKLAGFSENIVRSVRENSIQLGMDFATHDD